MAGAPAHPPEAPGRAHAPEAPAPGAQAGAHALRRSWRSMEAGGMRPGDLEGPQGGGGEEGEGSACLGLGPRRGEEEGCGPGRGKARARGVAESAGRVKEAGSRKMA